MAIIFNSHKYSGQNFEALTLRVYTIEILSSQRVLNVAYFPQNSAEIVPKSSFGSSNMEIHEVKY